MTMSPQSTAPAPSQRCHLQQVWLLLACALVPLACATPKREKLRLEAYSWWTQPSERRAFDAVLDIYNQAHDDSEAVNEVTGEISADAVRATLTARLLAEAPPSTFQANAGADLLRWTAMDTTQSILTSSSRIASIQGLFERSGLDHALPEELKRALQAGPSLNGLPYAVPLNIHRLNLIYYNRSALDNYVARTGQSFLEPAVLCPPDVDHRLDVADDKLDVTIAVGTKDSFTLTLFALEAMLPAVAGGTSYGELPGGTLYDQLFLGKLAESEWHKPVLRALQCVQYLSRSFLRDSHLSWAEALHRVEDGDADFSVMGDWANGELEDALRIGTVDAKPFPGSETTFVFTSDTFPLPSAAPHRNESEDLLWTLATPQAQLEFSREKGSIPARSDISLEEVRWELGERAAQTKADFDSPDIHKSIATSGLLPPYYPSDLSSKLSLMTAEGASRKSIEEVISLLRDALPLLRRWQNRIAEEQQAP